jgi:hypothetical protein
MLFKNHLLQRKKRKINEFSEQLSYCSTTRINVDESKGDSLNRSQTDVAFPNEISSIAERHMGIRDWLDTIFKTGKPSTQSRVSSDAPNFYIHDVIPGTGIGISWPGCLLGQL